MNMNEQQSDDNYVPTFLLTLPPKAGSNGRGAEDIEDFLKNVQGWSECFPPDAYDDWN
jgi:hypothetical protein